MGKQSPGRVFSEGFQRAEFERWDGVIAEDVTIDSPAGYGWRPRDARGRRSRRCSSRSRTA